MAGCLVDHVHEDGADGRQVLAGKGVGPHGLVQLGPPDDLVGFRDLASVEGEDVSCGLAVADVLPAFAVVAVVGEPGQRLAADDAAGPVVFGVDGEVLDHAKRTPSGRKYWPPKLLVRQAVQDVEDVLSVVVQNFQQLGPDDLQWAAGSPVGGRGVTCRCSGEWSSQRLLPMTLIALYLNQSGHTDAAG